MFTADRATLGTLARAGAIAALCQHAGAALVASLAIRAGARPAAPVVAARAVATRRAFAISRDTCRTIRAVAAVRSAKFAAAPPLGRAGLFTIGLRHAGAARITHLAVRAGTRPSATIRGAIPALADRNAATGAPHARRVICNGEAALWSGRAAGQHQGQRRTQSDSADCSSHRRFEGVEPITTKVPQVEVAKAPRTLAHVVPAANPKSWPARRFRDPGGNESRW